MTRSDVRIVIMAGGKGERLWPLVRARVPKACVPVRGHTSMLGATLHRLGRLADPARVMIVTTTDQADAVRRSVPPAFRRGVLAEPSPRNTAACIALATAAIAHRTPDAVMVVLPADHWVRQPKAFQRSLATAIDAAEQDDAIVTIGIRPTRPHSGLGHLCAGGAVARRNGLRLLRLDRFIEKPSPAAARRLARRRDVYWNLGIFVARASVFDDAIRRYLPGHASRIAPLGAHVRRPDFLRRAARAYRGVPAVSFDDGVMSRLRHGLIVEARFTWEDLGSWDAWARMPRAHGQPAVTVANRDVQIIQSDGHVIATVGLDHIAVVHTPDATLICPMTSAQAVRAVVARLARNPKLAAYL